MENNEIGAVFTVKEFAALQTAWPEYLDNGDGFMLARVHPDHNRPVGDDTVLARILVVDTKEKGLLRRLTIRIRNCEPTIEKDLVPLHYSEFVEERAMAYRRCLYTALTTLPTIRFAE